MTFEEAGLGIDEAATSGTTGTWGQGKKVPIDFVKTDRNQTGIPPVQELVVTKTADSAADGGYSAIAFVGGWGSSSYQYAYGGAYDTAAAEGPTLHGEVIVGAGNGGGPHVRVFDGASDTNRTGDDVVVDGRIITGETQTAAIDHGVSVLAWARVDGVSSTQASSTPIRTFVAPSDPSPDLGTVVEGTNGNDILFQSGDWWETLLGLGGDDVFVAVTSKVTPATDTWDGGGGVNTAYFGGVDTPVRVNLATGTAWRDQGGGGNVGGITLINIQDVVGSAHADTLTGDAGPNTLWGHGGNDLLIGGAGDDTLEGMQGNDILRGGEGVDVIRGGLGADEIRWHVGDLGRDEIEGFVLGEDRIAFGDGFLVTADPVNSLFVVGSFGEGVLMADTIEAGWQEIAIFRGISDDALQAAINNGVLFGYEAGPLADGAPGGFVGPSRPDVGRGGGDLAIRQESDGPGPAPQHPGGVNALMGDGSVRFLHESMDVGTWSAGLADPPDAFAMPSHIDDPGML